MVKLRWAGLGRYGEGVEVKLGARDGKRVNGEMEESGTREEIRVFGELEGKRCGRYEELDVAGDKKQGKLEKFSTAEEAER